MQKDLTRQYSWAGWEESQRQVQMGNDARRTDTSRPTECISRRQYLPHIHDRRRL